MDEPDNETPWRTALRKSMPRWCTDMPLDVIISRLIADDLLLDFEQAEIEVDENPMVKRKIAIKFFLMKDEWSIKSLNDIVQSLSGYSQLDLGVTAPVKASFFKKVRREMKEFCRDGIPRYRRFPRLFPNGDYFDFDLHMTRRRHFDSHIASIGTSVDDEVDGGIECDPDSISLETTSDLLSYLHKKDREIVIADGIAGVGKSFFSYNVVQKWATEENLQSHEIVILIELPGKPLSEVGSLTDLLQHAYYLSEDVSSEARNAVAEEIRRRRGKGVLFILDGADGASDVFTGRSSYLWKMVSNQSPECRYCSVLITTRPPVLPELHRCASLLVNIKGLSDQTMKKILDRWERVGRHIHPNLREHPFFRLLCKVPLYLGAAIHCSHLEEKVGLTSLFETFTMSLVHQSESINLEDLKLSDLPSDDRDFLIRIGSRLYELIKSNKFTFAPENLANQDDIERLSKLSLVFRNQQKSYQFSHQMFMEFLSALFLSKLTGDELRLCLENDIFLSSDSKHSRFAIVFRFFAGLTKFESPLFLDSSISFEKFLKPNDLRGQSWTQKLENFITILHGVHEAGNLEILNQVVSSYSNSGNYFEETMVTLQIPASYLYTSMDFATLAYAINNSRNPWSLILSACDVSQDNLGMLLSDAGLGLREIKLKEVTITDFGVDWLYQLLRCYQASLQSFSLAKLQDKFPVDLFTHLGKCQLRVLELRACKLSSECGRALSQCTLASLEKLNLSDNPELAESLPALAPALRKCLKLQFLEISNCSLGSGSPATAALIEYVKTSNLRKLWFEDDSLDPADISSLLEAVSDSTLTNLRLHESFFSDFRDRQRVGTCRVGFGLGVKQIMSEEVDHHRRDRGGSFFQTFQAVQNYLGF